MYVITTIFCDDFFPYCVAVIMHYFCDPDIAQPYTTWSTTLWSRIGFFSYEWKPMICSSDGITNCVFTNPELSICYYFFWEFFCFSNTNTWLFWHFLYILIPKQTLVLRRSKQAAKLLKINLGFVKTRFLKPSDEQIIKVA